MVSPPPVLVTVAVGLLIAFALQLLLLNLGVAAGITASKFLLGNNSETQLPDETEEKGSPIRMISFALGAGTLLMINSVLFVACFLAIALSGTDREIMGAILGVAIWSAYLLLMVWLGSTTVSATVGTVLGGLGAGWQGLQAIAQTIFGRKSTDPEQILQDRLIHEMKLLRESQETLNAMQNSAIQDLLKTYLKSERSHPELPTPTASPPPIDTANKTAQPALLQLADQFGISQVKVQDVVKTAVKNVVDQVSTQPLQETIIDYLQTAEAIELKPGRLQKHFKKLLQNSPIPTEAWAEQLTALQWDALKSVLAARQDLPDKAIDRLLSAIQEACDRGLTALQTKRESISQAAETVQQQFLTFLGDRQEKLNARNLQRQLKTVLKQTFKQKSLDLDVLKGNLPDLDRQTVVEILRKRQDLSEKRIGQISDRVERLWNTLQEVPKNPEVTQPNNSGLSPSALTHLGESGLKNVQDYVGAWSEEATTYLTSAPQEISEKVMPQISEYLSSLQSQIREQTDTLQKQTQQRLEHLQQKAYQQIETARSTSAIAAWWLFGTTFTSLFTAAIAGALAVRLWH
jgi:uncharacterized membrane protein YgcG